MRKDQYVIKNCYKQPIVMNKTFHNRNNIKLDSAISFDERGNATPHGITCLNPRVCEAALCNYIKLKSACRGNFESDLWYFMQEFDRLLVKALRD